MRRRADQSEPRRRPRAGWNSTALSPAQTASPKTPGIGTDSTRQGVPVRDSPAVVAGVVRSGVNQVHGLAVTGR